MKYWILTSSAKTHFWVYYLLVQTINCVDGVRLHENVFCVTFFFIICDMTKYPELAGSKFFSNLNETLKNAHPCTSSQSTQEIWLQPETTNKIVQDVGQQLKRVLKKLEKLATIESELSELSSKHVEER